MKSRFLLPAVFVITIHCGQNNASDYKSETTETNTIAESKSQTSDNTKPAKGLFEIKSAKIVFNYTGGLEQGTETLYFDNYGAVAVLVVDKKSKYTVNKQTIIWKDKKSTFINHENKNVASSPFRSKDTEPPSLADTDIQTRKKIGYEKLADETIVGKICEVWFNSKQNVKFWLWKKIDLKLENMGAYTKEAISVEEITSIPASVMEIPKDYKQ